MSGVFAHLGRLIGRHPRITVLVWLVLAVGGYGAAALGVHGGQSVFDRVTSGAPGVPGSQSKAADDLLARVDQNGESLTLVLSGVDPSSAAVAGAMAPIRQHLAAVPGVVSVVDPLALPGGPTNPAAAPLVARDGHGFLLVVGLDGTLDGDTQQAALDSVRGILDAVPAELSGVAPGATGMVGGASLIVGDIHGQVERDLRTGEAVALPIALLAMVFVFGGFLAAGMPMAGALASIGIGLAALLGLTYVMDVDASTLDVVTALGIGLSIDYGLLVVSRFREEIHRLVDADGGAATRRRRGDGTVATAIERTLATAGRTVTFSAVTVAISIAGLLVFSPPILRSIGAASVAIVVVALGTALSLVPALLVWTGRRLSRPSPLLRVPWLRAVMARTSDVDSSEGFFSRLTARVQRRPWWVVAGCVLVLGVIALPVRHLELRNSGAELLPAGSSQRAFIDEIAANYPAAQAAAVTVIAETSLASATRWSDELAALHDVASVDPPRADGSYVLVGLRPDSTDAGGAVARTVVTEVRGLDPGFPVWVTGQAAHSVDFTAALAARVWWVVGIVALATLVLLFLMTGSVVIPVKALLTNALSLAAALGVLVWGFQDAHLSGVLDFIPVGGIESYVVALVLAFAFGLAMDYEVFLLSRVKELHDAGHPTEEAVRLGLQRSGRVITSAAAIIIVVFAGFVAGRLLIIKEVGFALAVAVFVDASLVRCLLVPATMTVLGRWNWWAPRPLKRLHERVALLH
jgi:RND superfamily putative drug exporter